MDLIEKVVNLSKRRGFVYPGSEIYGGLANTYDYGPLGAQLLKNIKDLWWEFFITSRTDMYGLDSNILMSPKVWEASGHTANFTDTLVDCKECQYRKRADHLIEEYFESKGEEKKVEGLSEAEQDEIIQHEKIPCPNCKKHNWTKVRKFNTLFETHLGIVSSEKSLAYLRGEIAQGMFVNFKNVLDSFSPKLPFGIGQMGAAFRNEITPGKFIHRTLSFNLSEFEYFFDSQSASWEELYTYWEKEMWTWATEKLGLPSESLRWREHSPEERSHYSKMTKDIEFKYPWGFKELYGLAYRTDFDLKNHMEKSGVDLRYTDPISGNKFIPHVIEPTFGMDRSLLSLLLSAYTEDGDRVVLKLKPKLAPYKMAVFPLVRNKENIVNKAREVFTSLKAGGYAAVWDDRGNIGKRYYVQDEIGTPWCVTVDYQTLEDSTVTIRDRDSAAQHRLNLHELDTFFTNGLK